MDEGRLIAFLVLWMCAFAILVIGRARRRVTDTGLVLAYVLNLAMIHWVAPALYLLPQHRNYDVQIVEAGLQQSLYAVIAFAVGSLFLTPIVLKLHLLPPPRPCHTPEVGLAKTYLLAGMVFYTLLSMGITNIPSATSLAAAGQQLTVVGLCLCCWYAWKVREHHAVVFWIGLTMSLPFVTIVTSGFIGYGAVAALIVVVFVSGFVRSRPRVIVAAALLVYLGLSVYVTYMRDRTEIRETVWGGQPLGDRLERVDETFTNFEWFDLGTRAHLERVDERLNQSFLVGLAVSRLSHIGGYAEGRTFGEATLALIPRAIWPEKPSNLNAGSGDMVTEFTGLRFAAGTSVGIGQVMEFYVNFGTVGVVIGFLLMGVLVTTLDHAAAERLSANDVRGFALWYLPAISVLQVGGSLVEVTTGAVASVVVALLVNTVLAHRTRAGTARGTLPISMRSAPLGQR